MIEVKALQSLCFSTSVEPKNNYSTRKRQRHSLLPRISSTPSSPTASLIYTDKGSDMISKNLFNMQIKILDIEKLVKNVENEIRNLSYQVESLTQKLLIPDIKSHTPTLSRMTSVEE
jgi:hypothetical protein